MLKRRTKLFLLPIVAAAFICFGTQNAFAFLPIPPGPVTPTNDPLTDAMMYVDYGAQYANAYASAATNVMQEQTKFVKSAASSLAGEVTGLMPTPKEKKNKEKAVKGSKKIKKSKVADVEKPSAVKKAFYKLFLAFPSDESDVMGEYSKKADEFYKDTIIETYVASREMEKELNALEAKFAKLSPMLVQGSGEGGAQPADDNNGAWKNAYTAYDTMNELLKITEELAAMRAQLTAARVLKHSLSPAEYKKGKKKRSALDMRGSLQMASSSLRSGNETLVFAQVDFNSFRKAEPITSYNSDNGAASVASIARERRAAAAKASRQEAIGLISGAPVEVSQNTALNEQEDDEDYEYDPTTDSSVNFVTAELPDIDTPFAGNEEKMAELNKLDPLYEQATKALEIHNLIQSLPSYRENAEKYNQYVRLHDKSLEMLKSSDQCVLQYLGRYYGDPEKVWSGGPLSDDVANYDLRTGISGWAVKTFEVAKAERTSATDLNDVGAVEVDVPADVNDMTTIGDREDALRAKSNQGQMNPSNEEEVEKINRETGMIAWKIGAEAAKILAQDQYSAEPQWGVAQTKFPIWNDQKNFYNQYIDGKYNNIKEYLSALEFNQQALTIAQQLNDLVAETMEIKAYNARELAKLSARLEAENEEDDNVEKEDEENPELAALGSQRSSAIAKAQAKRDAALKPLQEQKNNLNAQLDAASEALNNFNERINKLKQESVTADVSVDGMRQQLEYVNEVEEYGKEPENTETVTVKTTKEVQKTIAPVLNNDEEPLNVNNTSASVSKAASKRTKFRLQKDSAFDNGLRFAASDILVFGALSKTELKEERGLLLQTKTYTETTETEQQVINDEDSESQAYAKEVINQNNNSKASSDAEIKRYQKLAKVQEEKIARLKEQLEQLEPQITAVNQLYTQSVQEIEQQYTAGVEAARKKINDNKALKAARSLLSIYKDTVERTVVGDLIGTSSVKGIISQAEGLIGDTKSYAVQAIEKARGDLYKLGDELYLPNSAKMVVKRHAELMKELQSIPVDKLIASSSSLGKFGTASAVTSTLTTLFQKALTQKACADGRCEKADEQYYIGLMPKPEDFAAPKAAPEMYMPPLREIVHFDTVDYEAVPKGADGAVSRDGFLNYGGEVPAVWQMILKEKAFVERDVDINAILEAGNGREGAFMRGGRYPCRLDEKIIDVDPYDGQYMVVGELTKADGTSSQGAGTDIAKNAKTQAFLKKLGINISESKVKNVSGGTAVNEDNLPKCQEIEMVGNTGVFAKFYYTVRDIEADTEGPAAIQPKESIGNPSELGTLLKAVDNGGLRMADKPLEVFSRLKEIIAEQDSSDKEYKANLKDEIFQNAKYDVNQFGDFLGYVEIETTYRQNKEELKANVDDGNKMLREALTEAGFTPAANFDISKESDYNLARGNLDRLKNKLVNEGFSGVSEVDVTNNEVVEERLNKIKGIFTALRKDKDELLALSENSPSDSELDEQIKTEEVNQKVVGEYKKKADEEFEKQLNNFKRPFCAAY